MQSRCDGAGWRSEREEIDSLSTRSDRRLRIAWDNVKNFRRGVFGHIAGADDENPSSSEFASKNVLGDSRMLRIITRAFVFRVGAVALVAATAATAGAQK